LKSRPIVILTALDLEYDAVREKLTKLKPYRSRAGTHYEVGQLRDGGGEVVLGLAGKGNHSSAVLTERAIGDFDPAGVMFTGIAGALWPDIALGEVVVATHVYGYHGGTSENDGMKARPRVWEAPHEWLQIAHQVARSLTGVVPVGEGAPLGVRFGPVAAGEVVQDSNTSAQASWIRDIYNDALAIEMEAAGVSQAAQLNGSLPAMIVRGISDHADGTKTMTDRVNWRAIAAANAATFATALASELATLQSSGRIAEPTRRERTMTEVRNVSRGNSGVQIQAGQIHGNVSIGAGPEPQPKSEPESQPENQPKPPVATRSALTFGKLRGLITEVTELAARMVVVVTGLRVLS
jgi:8-oxo-dGTP diphosphatase